ncbi:MAG: ABC transporter permease [Promethearchaeota archaeon]
MVSPTSLKRSLKQTMALVERNIYFEIRFKGLLITRFFGPIIQILMPLIIFGVIFNLREDYQFGYWNGENYILFMLIAFCIQFLRQIIDNFRQLFLREKYWKSLQALLIAPINRYVLLFGFLISEMILISIAFLAFFIIAAILFSINIFTLLLVILLFLCSAIIFGSIGLIVGVLIITKEGILGVFTLGLRIIFWLSCFSYPLQVFPEIVQFFILLNPLYYIIDIIRLTWLMGIDAPLALTFITPTHIIILVLFTVFLPIISVYLFNKFYDRFGISGY